MLSHSSTGQLIFKSGPSKPKLELISLCQWSMASLAILYKMLEEDSLSQANKIDYLSYTTRIYQLIRDRPFNLQGGGVWFFVSFRIFFSDNTKVRIFIFFVAQSAIFFSRI